MRVPRVRKNAPGMAKNPHEVGCSAVALCAGSNMSTPKPPTKMSGANTPSKSIPARLATRSANPPKTRRAAVPVFGRANSALACALKIMSSLSFIVSLLMVCVLWAIRKGAGKVAGRGEGAGEQRGRGAHSSLLTFYFSRFTHHTCFNDKWPCLVPVATYKKIRPKADKKCLYSN